jgi:hypothetical protein
VWQATRPHPSEQQDRHAECASCQRKCEKCGLGRARAVIEGILKRWLKIRIGHTFPLEKAAEGPPKTRREKNLRQTPPHRILT